ncbi:Crp/Fnr family transcriptional regulator [Aestuariivirga sp.]|uniref:Crp/Fnr family transcriptional regulator n=1 Tax=Aestuariivirga sp. TaxID=2650926 RepID=UPI0039E50E02
MENGKRLGAAQGTQRQDIHNSGIPVVCASCEARHRGICGALSPAQLSELSKHTAKGVISPEAKLALEDDPADHYSNILKGVVKLSKLMADGRQQIVGLQFASDLVGKLFGERNDFAAEAATEVQVCTFPRSALEHLVSEVPELEQRLHRQTQRELAEAREWMLMLGRKSATERVASFLHFIALHSDPEHPASGKAMQFEIPLKRSDIADFLGLTIETVSRQFTKLRQIGAIRLITNRVVEVPDLERLREISESG